MKNVKVILKTGDLTKIKPMMWRFESIDHPLVEINLSRDTDTRILLREKLAVEQWLLSDKLFHIKLNFRRFLFHVYISRFAFAETTSMEMVDKAKNTMDEKEIDGRILRVRGTKVNM